MKYFKNIKKIKFIKHGFIFDDDIVLYVDKIFKCYHEIMHKFPLVVSKMHAKLPKI